MKIELKDTDIDSLLNSRYFHVPRFQRPYSWEDENISDFWEDIITNQSDDYFIGSMVVYKKKKQHYALVDGQQRITTITIMLCVLRDYFDELGFKDLAEGIHQLIERKDRNNIAQYVLKTETSFPYFQEQIQKYGEDAEFDGQFLKEELNLKNAHVRFQKLIGSAIESIENDTTIPEEKKLKTKKSKLIELREAVSNLNLIFITLDNEDDAYLIFETLNTRGKDLALTDLVKNHFSKHIKSTGEVDHAKIKWEKILETIRSSSIEISTDTFIYHYWASRYEAIPQKKLFRKLKKEITKQTAKKHLNRLVKDSHLYRSLHEVTYQWKKNEVAITKSLTAFQLFKLAQPTPAVLSLIRAYRSDIIKNAKLRDTLRAIEKFHFIFTAITSSRSSGGISAMYSSFARKLFNAKDSGTAADEIKVLVGKLRSKIPSLDEFTVAFKEVNFTNSNTKQKKLVQYILRSFSEHHKYKYPSDYDELTVEHLHAQADGDEEWTVEVIGSLGNMILLDEEMNGKLSTKDFPKKKKLLKDKGYTVPKFIAEQAAWTPESVNTHAEQMAKLAYEKIWKI